MPHTIDPITGKQRRGFAGMSLERRTAIARIGGKSAAPENRAYSRDNTLAVTAGRKGGLASRRIARAVPEAAE